MNLANKQQNMRNRRKNVSKSLEPAPRYRYLPGFIFYVIDVLPRDGKRFRFGCTSDLDDRVEQFRRIAPDCVVVRQYRCDPVHVAHVFDCIRLLPGVTMISKWVADLRDPDVGLHKLDELFKRNRLG